MQTGARLSASPYLRHVAVLPGLTLALLLATTARYVSELIGIDGFGFAKSPVSPVLLAILFGLAIRNLAGVPERCEAGVQFALSHVLKIGIGLLGIRLSLSAVGEIGAMSVPIVIACIATALIVVNLLTRWLGLSARLGTLIAVGTSICGCTAIMAVAPAIRAQQSEVAYAITCVALFGTIGMLAYPFLAQALFADNPMAAGVFLGTAIHDTSQVVGAGMLYEQYFQSSAGLEAATVTKLFRNLSMLVVIPVLTYLFARSNEAEPDRPTDLKNLLPLFVAGFVAMSLLRTAGDLGDAAFGFIPVATWRAGIELTTHTSNLLLAVSMAAVGLSTCLTGIRRIGYQPLAMGFAAAALVGVTSVGLLSLLR